jgi:hypothetical protein
VWLRFKIICYVVAWLVALFATNATGKYWPLAYMFPLGLAAFFSRYWTNTGGWGVFSRSHRGLPRSRLVLFPLAKVVVDTASIRRSRNSAYLQRLGLPCHAEYALTSDRSL